MHSKLVFEKKCYVILKKKFVGHVAPVSPEKLKRKKKTNFSFSKFDFVISLALKKAFLPKLIGRTFKFASAIMGGFMV